MKDFTRYAIGVVMLVIAIVLIVVGFNMIRNIFTDDKPAQQQSTKKVDLLAVPQEDKTVQYTIDGAVVGEETHRSIRIRVDRDSRTVEVIQGYDNNILKSEEFPNKLEAYETFVAALKGAGFANVVSPDGRGEEKQSCPLGYRYVYEVEPNASDTFRTWSTSCGGKQGTFTGNAKLIQTLFQRQIPDYNKYTSDVRLG